MNSHSLPALQFGSNLYLGQYETIRRTIYIDECRVSMQFIAFDHNIDDVLLIHSRVHILVIGDESDSFNIINAKCQSIWNQKKSMKNVLIIRMLNSNQKSRAKYIKQQHTLNEVARYWNVPCLSLCFDNTEKAMELFHFAVKYYWFCNVV